MCLYSCSFPYFWIYFFLFLTIFQNGLLKKWQVMLSVSNDHMSLSTPSKRVNSRRMARVCHMDMAFVPFHNLFVNGGIYSPLFFLNDYCACVNHHHHQCLIGVGCLHWCPWRFSCQISAHDLHFFSPGFRSVENVRHNWFLTTKF